MFKIRHRECYHRILFTSILSCVVLVSLSAQSALLSQSEKETTYTEAIKNFQRFHPERKMMQTNKKDYSIMLPSTAMKHSPPLFCRLEDRINKDNKIQCLFRLGSVSYVNFLEQKGDHQRLMLEQLQ